MSSETTDDDSEELAYSDEFEASLSPVALDEDDELQKDIRILNNLMSRGDFDPDFEPPVEPKIRPRQLHWLLRRFFQALALWHVMHVIMAGAFLYFSIHWVSTAYPKAPEGCVGTNGTLIDYTTFPNTDDYAAQRDACKDYQKFLLLNSKPWKTGVILYACFNGCTAAASILYSFYLWRKLNKMQPKDAKAVLGSIFCGFPKGTFMVSYCWRDEADYYDRPQGEMPRKIGSYFPPAWLDIENLIPGTPVKTACRNAARNSLFRFAFISKNYLASPNCLVEWNEIRLNPGRSLIFAYPETPEKELKSLEKLGHLVIRLDEDGATRQKILDPQWFVTQLLCTRRASPLFRLHSPGINEHWRPSLRFWYGHSDWQFFLLSVPVILGSVTVVAIDFFVAWYYEFQVLFTGFEGTAFLFAMALVLPALLLVAGLYIFWYLQGTGFKVKGLPDVAYLLIFLIQLGVIDPVKFYSNSEDVVTTHDFQSFISSGAVTLCDDSSEADIRCLLLDEVEEGAYKKEEVDDRYVMWTRNGFINLSNYAKDTFGTHIIGDEVPGVEFLGSKILMHAFHVQAEDLTVGKLGFKSLFQKNNPNSKRPKKGGCCKRNKVNAS